MLTAISTEGKRIVADMACDRTMQYFCPACGERVALRAGQINKPHFSHKPATDCKWGNNQDNKSEWHLRMQNYFPQEYLEHKFIDEKNKEIHIADVYIPEKGIVIEFQNCAITTEEFYSRTNFHLSEGRRIVWVFNERKKNTLGEEFVRLRYDDLYGKLWPYEATTFQWLRNPRKCLNSGPDLTANNERYSIFVWNGEEGENAIRRIMFNDFDYKYITLSFNVVFIEKEMDYEEFFYGDRYWLKSEKYKNAAEKFAKIVYKRGITMDDLLR